MRHEGLYDEHYIQNDNGTEEGGYRAARKLLTERGKVDALVMFNDNMAVGAYRAIHELGLNIPDDIAVASFNDISVAQFMNPPLSTVHLPAEEIGETAVELLLERAGGRDLAKRITLASRLIWRGSTRHAVTPRPV
jgi:LacI family transcriptional regulator